MSSNTKLNRPWEGVAPRGAMLRPSVVVERTGLSKSSIYEMISEGRFPPFVKLSARASAMPEAWLNAFISAKAADAICNNRPLDRNGEVVQ
jgi:prophage regulatory protein